MNERIKKLMEESVSFRFDPDSLAYEAQVDPEDLEYFAELIVRECLKEIKDMIVDESEQLYVNNKQTTADVNDRLLDAYDNIQDLFGLDEE